MQQFAPVEYIKVFLESWSKQDQSSQLSEEYLLNFEQHGESLYFFKGGCELWAMQQQCYLF